MTALSLQETYVIDRPTATDEADVTSGLFRVLSSPVRVRIVSLLSRQERRVHELVSELNLSQPLVSQHLRILRSNRLVHAQRSGREMIYSLSNDHVADLVDAASHVVERS